MSDRVFSQTFGVVGAIIEKDGKILLVKEAHGTDKGKWSHPAGWIDVGEDPIKAAAREVLEETGLKWQPTHLLGVYSLVRQDAAEEVGGLPHAIKLIFKGQQLSGAQQPLADDITETRWFTLDEIQSMGRDQLRDQDIKQMVKDYFAGQELPLGSIKHYLQTR